MFVRQFYQTCNGRRHAYWALVESYRTERGPRQRVVAWLGNVDEQGRLGVQQAAEGAAVMIVGKRRCSTKDRRRSRGGCA